MTGNVYKQTTLGEIAVFTNGGAWSQTEYCDKGVPVVRVTDIKDETVNLSGCKFLPQSSLTKYDKHLLQEGDLVICTVGSHPTQPGSVVGRAAIMPEAADGALLNQNAVCIRSSLPNLDQCWLGYLGRSEKFHDYIISCARGSANQVRMAIGLLKEMPIEVPPLSVQRRIAGILSAYDDLLENNQRRIKILEEMARSLYREWFVHFRFPGHDKVKLVRSPLGPIPQGWEVKRLAEIAKNFDRLRKPLSKMERVEMQGEYPYYGAAKVFDYVNNFIFNGEYLLMAEDGSVITPERAPVLQLANEKFWPNNHTHILSGKAPVSTHFLYLGLSLVDISPYITGAAQPKITQENMNRIPFFCGPADLHKHFDRLVAPMIHGSQALQRMNVNLRRTRDLLLPRLLSGEVAV